MAKTAALLAATLAALCLCSPAHALSNRAWVSGHGTDTGGCGSPASPCRTFQYVHDNIIAAGGEIDVLDPAGYGPVTITKALSIVNDGVGTAGVQAASGNAITINAGSGDAVTLRGLSVEGLGTGSYGVQVLAAGRVAILGCSINGFSTAGISAGQQSTQGALLIADSVLASVGTPNILIVGAGGGLILASVKNVRVTGGNTGIEVDAGTASHYVTISDTIIEGAAVDGVSNNGGRVVIERTTILGSGFAGVAEASDSGFTILTNSTVVGSGNFDLDSLGLLETAKNNVFGPTNGPISNYSLN